MASEIQKKITLYVEYPQVIKQYFSSKIEAPPSATLDELKTLVFDSFWKLFTELKQDVSIHGKKEQICLKDKMGEIKTDDELRKRLGESSCFQAVFIKHGKP